MTLVPHDLLAYGHRSRVILCSQGEGQPPLVLKATRLDAADAAAPAAAPDGGAYSTLAERVRREIELSSLSLGPFVVSSHGWLSVSPHACLLLDYLPGGDLDLLVDRNGPLGPQSARFYVGCAALGLEALHARGIAHRDIKPENLCIDAAGYAVIADLGFARRLPPGDNGRACTLLGTPEYLSPEVFLGEGHGTPSDLWALGATLYTLLLSAHPYGGQTTDEVYAAALRVRQAAAVANTVVGPTRALSASRPASFLLALRPAVGAAARTHVSPTPRAGAGRALLPTARRARRRRRARHPPGYRQCGPHCFHRRLT